MILLPLFCFPTNVAFDQKYYQSLLKLMSRLHSYSDMNCLSFTLSFHSDSSIVANITVAQLKLNKGAP